MSSFGTHTLPILLAALLSIAHCSYGSAVYETGFSNVMWDNANRVLTTSEFSPGVFTSRMPSANGYMGISLAAIGPFYEFDNPADISGWPLFNRRQTFATMSGFYDEQPHTNGTNFPWLEADGGESVISGVPHWGPIVVVLPNGRYLDATVNRETISNFSSSLDFKRGLSMWQYTWAPEDSDGLSFEIRYSLFTNKLDVNQAVVQLQIKPSQDCNVSIANVLDGRNAVRTDFAESGVDGRQIYTAVHPSGIQNVTAYLYAVMEATSEIDMSTLTLISDEPFIGQNDSTIAQAAQASLKAGKTATITKFVGGATSDGFLDPQGLAKSASLKALKTGYEQSLINHVAEWVIVMPEDSFDNYGNPENGTLPDDPMIIQAQIMAVVSPYYLLMNTVSQDALARLNGPPIDKWSISVCGLTSDCYGGLVFWDAEIWMQPGLVVAFPDAAKQIALYRVATYSQALANVKTAYTSSKNHTNFSSNAAIYPWTGGRYGNCTGTGPCFDYEYHINADIVLELINYWVASGDTEFFRESLLPIISSVSALFSGLLEKNGTSYTLTNMTDPDEYANNVDNGGYTMPAIATTLTYYNRLRELFGMERIALYDEQAANVMISRDPSTGITLEYTGMNNSIAVKQADVVLDAFPLNYSPSPSSSSPASSPLLDLDYYAAHQSPSGPGMTFAIFAIAASTISPSGCSAYTYQSYSTAPYIRAPWFQLSEQINDNVTQNGGTHPAFPFLTGHGGANQVPVFAYLGLRLLPDWVLHVDPSLPPQIERLRFRTLWHHGWPVSAVANRTHTALTRGPTPARTANATLAHAPIVVEVGAGVPGAAGGAAVRTYDLPPNGTLVLRNRLEAYNKTEPGNIAQGLPVTSAEAYQPGQFPLAAVDGAASTKWIPNLAHVSQSLVVDLSSVPFQPVRRLHFDWAQNLPVRATVRFYNSSGMEGAGAGAGAEGGPGGEGTAIAIDDIVISKPYVASRADVIVPYVGNTTTVTVGQGVWSGRFAELTIWGNQGDGASNATGASVAEFAIIGGVG